MEAKLRGDGLNPHVYSVFKTAMLTRWASVAPGLNAHGRLDALKQTKSVDTYMDAFNSIASNAVDNPIVGAEACYFFQKGLKDSISSLFLKNSSIGGLGEFGDVAELAARAQALDALTSAQASVLCCCCRGRGLPGREGQGQGQGRWWPASPWDQALCA